MVHPATVRATLGQFRALGVEVDIGAIHPTGRAFWLGRSSDSRALNALLPRFAGENARGANIYFRIYLDRGWADDTPHPGVVLLDDLTEAALSTMAQDDITPATVVETSAGNYQTWVRIAKEHDIDCGTARATARLLAARYGADPNAVAAAQPGRLAGFTNRKEKHRKPDGKQPFCRLISTTSSSVMPAEFLVRSQVERTPQPRGGAASRETPRGAAEMDAAQYSHLQQIWAAAHVSIEREVAAGTRIAERASPSEIDFRGAAMAIRRGIDSETVGEFISRKRPDKAQGYSARTIAAVLRLSTRPLEPNLSQNLGPKQ